MFVWADSIPKLLQARLIESFENYDIAHAPLRTADVGQADFQLLIDVRRFRIAMDSEPVAEIGLSARIVDKDGKVVASRLFEGSGNSTSSSRRSRRRVQRCVRSGCEGYDRLDRAGAVQSWLIAWLMMLPIVLFAAPSIRSLTHLLTREG